MFQCFLAQEREVNICYWLVATSICTTAHLFFKLKLGSVVYQELNNSTLKKMPFESTASFINLFLIGGIRV
jgi:hypothetical protein